MAQATYEIRVAGTVPERDLRDMGAVTLAVDQVNTVLYGIPDQAALYGLLARLRALGIEVVEVRRGSRTRHPPRPNGATPTPERKTMSSVEPDNSSYQVVVLGELGPAFVAFCARTPVYHSETSSVFQLRARDGQGIADLAARVQAAGLMILSIRQVAVREVWAVAGSSA